MEPGTGDPTYPLPTTGCFTTLSPHTARGLKPPITVTFGNRSWSVIPVGAPTPVVAGSAPTAAGPLFPKNLSAGPAITTAAGLFCAESAGYGFPETNGRRLGFAGAKAEATSAGHRCLRKPSVGVGTTGTRPSRHDSESAPRGSHSSLSNISRNPPTATACRSARTSFSSGKPTTSPTSTSVRTA